MKTLFRLAVVVPCLALLLGGSSIAGARKSAAPAKPFDVAWLKKPAERAVLLGQYAKAAVLYQGALSLQAGNAKLTRRLALIYTMGGQFSQAQDALRRYISIVADAANKTWATGEIKRLDTLPAPFINDDVSQIFRQRKFAFQALRSGRTHERKRRYRAAASYYEAALVMDPTLVGVYRFLGRIYSRLKDRKRAQNFYIKYLRLRPGGKLASRVRRRVRKNRELGKVTFKASFPAAVYINRGRVGKLTPIKNVVLPAGRYTVVIYSAKYHAARKIRIVVKARKKQTVKFEFGVLHVTLSPWARIRANGRDIGLWDEVGMPATQYRLSIVSHDGAKRMTKTLKLRAGKKFRIARWK